MVNVPSRSSGRAIGILSPGGSAPGPVDAGGLTTPPRPVVVVGGRGTVVVDEVDVDVDVVEVAASLGAPSTANVDVSSLANALTAITPHASTSATAETTAIRACRR